jgi:hypothetical protein
VVTRDNSEKSNETPCESIITGGRSLTTEFENINYPTKSASGNNDIEQVRQELRKELKEIKLIKESSS